MKITNILKWPWTRWSDILTFSYGGGYLLQGRRNRITGRTQFAVRKMGQWWRLDSSAPMATTEQLERAGLWEQQP